MGKLTHGESYARERTPEYVAWTNMIQRCENQQLSAHHLYANVRVHQAWRESFAAFLADTGRRPTAGHSLDRYPDPDGNYEPGNVRWATEAEQQQNRRNNHNLTAFGETLCITEWARRTRLCRGTIRERLRSGATPEEAVSSPAYKPLLVEFDGRTVTITALSKLTGIPNNSLRRRLMRHNWNATEAIAAWQNNTKGKKPSKS